MENQRRILGLSAEEMSRRRGRAEFSSKVRLVQTLITLLSALTIVIFAGTYRGRIQEVKLYSWNLLDLLENIVSIAVPVTINYNCISGILGNL